MIHSNNDYMNIAFTIDAKYTPHLEALIKSICYYNQKVNFYVLHNDIPQEWFEGIQSKLEKIGHHLFSIHISDDIFKIANYYNYTFSQEFKDKYIQNTKSFKYNYLL